MSFVMNELLKLVKVLVFFGFASQNGNEHQKSTTAKPATEQSYRRSVESVANRSPEFLQCPPFKHQDNTKIVCYHSKHVVSCHDDVDIGTVAILQCPPFYISTSGYGGDVSECLPSGEWSRTQFECSLECGKLPSGTPLIVHGETTKASLHPWHTALYNYVDDEWTYWCGGTLISDRVVLTAAHCIWNITPQNITVAVGKYFRSFSQYEHHSQRYQVLHIEMLETYQDVFGNYNGDLAVLFLTKPVEMSAYVRPACVDWELQYTDVHITEGNLGTVAGWGINENDTFGNKLESVSLPVVSLPECLKQQKTDFKKFITYTTFCAGYNNGTGVCNGDSGGGLLFPESSTGSWFVQGVVSVSPRRRNSSFCDPRFSSVFTKVSMFVKWLKKMVDSWDKVYEESGLSNAVYK